MDYSRLLEDDDRIRALAETAASHWAPLQQRSRDPLSAAWLTWLDRAGRCLEAGEIYCEVGQVRGAPTIAAIANNPDVTALVIEEPGADLSVPSVPALDRDQLSLEDVSQLFADWKCDDRVWLDRSEIQPFFANLGAMGSDDRIGLLVDRGRDDYRSQMQRLLAVAPWLAERAVIVSIGSGAGKQQAIEDFFSGRGFRLKSHQLPDNLATDGAVEVVLWSDRHDASLEVESREASEPWRLLAQAELIRPDRLRDLLYDEARFHHGHQRYDTAERAYRTILQDDPQHIGALYHLGLIFFECGRYPQAIAALWQAIAIERQGLKPASGELANAYYGLGLTYSKTGDVPRAIAAYQAALEFDPVHFTALNNLGSLHYDLDRLDDARALFDRAVAAQPHRPGGYLNQARVCLERYDVDDAIVQYDSGLAACSVNKDRETLEASRTKALRYRDDPRLLCRQLAAHARDHSQPHRTLRHTRHLYKLDPTPANALTLMQSERVLHHYDEALAIGDDILGSPDRPPEPATVDTSIAVHFICIQLEIERGCFDRARERSDTATRRYPRSALLQLQQVTIVPILYESVEQLEHCRTDLIARLDGLDRAISRSLEGGEDQSDAIEPSIPPEAWLAAFQKVSHVQTHYQGGDRRTVQEDYSRAIAKVAAHCFPQLSTPRQPAVRDPRAPLKIGYVSSTLGPARLGKLSIGWLEHHDRTRFTLHGYYVNSRSDALTERFRAACDRFYHCPNNNLEAIAQTIVGDDLDILVFTDLGLDPQLLTLAALRLAPVQCTTWAHPVTTGLPTVDAFLSSAAMEIEAGDRHYSETLVRLSDIGIVFPKPVLASATDAERQQTREQFGLAGDRALLLCCQSLFKYMPQDDWIWAEIAARAPEAQFVFISHPSPDLTQQFEQRLERAFSERGIEMDDRVMILPRLSETDYLRINQTCDVFLDSFGWSGGVTTLKAIACGLPVITCPGERMRSRHSAGILQTLGVTETIAVSPQEYIDLAAKLAIEPDWRTELRQAMAEKHARLYDNPQCVRDLEAFFGRCVTFREG